MSSFGDLPEELQRRCSDFLNTSSVGRFSQVNKACKELVGERLVADKAALHCAVLERVTSRWCETLAATCRVADGPDLITFSDGGAKLFKCTCYPDKEFAVGRSASNLARHMASRLHWNHWRLAAHGEAQPTEAAWLAFAASLPGALAPHRRV